ncbi:MAG: signal peptidase I [Lachnospiraceae bacterium]|nr:signal peptidase I [Lachnospiraceae bacterium]
MSYNNKEDDIIVFDPFDDEGYEKWLKARQEAQKAGIPTVDENPELSKIEFPADEPEADEAEPVRDKTEWSAAKTAAKADNHGHSEASVNSTVPVKTPDPAEKKNDAPADASDKKELTPAEKKRRLILNITEIAVYLIMAVLIIKLVPKYVMERVSVEGESMKETLQDGDQLIGEKLSVRFNSLKRYDIIYFAPKGNHKSVDFIKRIIGMPGEMIYIVDSVVYINGRPLQEDFAAEDQFLSYTAANPIYLGEDEYFVMGDNRNHSTDSRSSSVGIVHGKDIEGRAVFRLWPLSGFGRID